MDSKANQDHFKALESLVEEVDKMAKMNKQKVEEHFTRFDGIQKDLKTEQFEKNNELRELVHQMDIKMKELEEKLEEAVNGESGSGSGSGSEEQSHTNT